MIGAWGKQQRGGKRMLICICLKQNFPCFLVAQSCPNLCDPVLQHTTLPCPSQLPGVCSNSCSLSWWCHPTIAPSVIPFTHVLSLSRHQGLLQWVGSSPMSWVFSNELALHTRGPKYWSFSFSISSYNEYSGLVSFRTDWFDLLAVQETLRVFSSTTVRKHQFFHAQPSLWSISHIHTWLLEKP